MRFFKKGRPPIPRAGADTLLRRVGDGPHAIEVHDDGDTRWLKFGVGAIQSRVRLDAPLALPLPYTLGMVAPLLFKREFDQILMFGLGGGALLRFYHRYFGHANFEVVDNNSLVAKVARAYFDAPTDDARVSLTIGDARDQFIASEQQYDLIMVDLFNAHGLPDWLRGPEFHRDCRERLRTGGLSVTNLWVNDRDEMLKITQGLKQAYDDNVLLLTPPGSQNLIVLAFNDASGPFDLPALYARARELREATALEFPRLVDALRRTNRTESNCLVV